MSKYTNIIFDPLHDPRGSMGYYTRWLIPPPLRCPECGEEVELSIVSKEWAPRKWWETHQIQHKVSRQPLCTPTDGDWHAYRDDVLTGAYQRQELGRLSMEQLTRR